MLEAQRGIAQNLKIMERDVRTQLQREFANPTPAQRLELIHRSEDYVTWQLMNEAPQHVEELATKVAKASDPSARPSDTLTADILTMLSRLYRDLLSPTGPEITPDQHD